MSLIFDAHLDLAMNALEWNRNLILSVKEIQHKEQFLKDKPDRGKGTVSLDAMRKGNIGLCVATQIARYVKPENNLPGWNSPEQAWAQTQGQLAWYRAMEDINEMTQIKSKEDLENHILNWNNNPKKPIGYILSLEGADSIISMEHLHKSYEDGLRAIGPAHYGPGTYAYGTDSSGSIGAKGRKLLDEIEKLNLILDATHLCDISFWETMERFSGPVWASHNNCRSLVPNERQFDDKQIKELIKRKAIIGVCLDAWMIIPDWKRGISTPKGRNLSLENIVDHIDHICQLSGDCNHVGIGSDLDGAFGNEQCPYDLNTIADLQKIKPILKNRGYSELDIEKIFHENFINFLMNTWS
tara:strand:+ start:744 stop:1808 length:1065 start_codon:yes stop_codon:yes gene_type:complete